MSNKLSLVFNVRPGEGRLVTLLLVHSFFVGMTEILLSTAAGTLFLVNFGAQSMSYVYVGSAVFAPLFGFLYTRLQRRVSFARLLSANLGFLLLGLGGFYSLLLLLPGAGWPSMALYIWYYVQDALINLEFWALAGRLFDVRQGKRLFGLIGTGEMIARSISGFAVSPLVQVIGTPNLLLLAAGGVACSLALLVYINRLYHPGSDAAQARKEQAGGEEPLVNLVKNRYILLIISLSILAYLAFYFVEIAFLGQTKMQYPDRDELAGFLGAFYATAGIVGLLGRVFLAGPLINSYGLMAGLLALPIMLSTGVASTVVVGTLSGAAGAIFWPVVASRFFYAVFWKATNSSATPILYQPLPSNRRLRAQTFVEGIVQPATSGLAGVILLLLSFASFSTVQLYYVLSVIIAVWIAVVIMLSREYLTVLLQVLNSRRLDDFSFALADASSMAVLKKGLESPHAGEVFYFLDMLERADQPLEAPLRKLLWHRAPEVRREALRRIERLGLTSVLRQIVSMLRVEPSPQVRGAALRTLAALGETEVFEQVLPYLEDPEPQARQGAMVGLLRSGGIEGILVAGERLVELTNSPDSSGRQFASRVLGEVGIGNFYRPLLKLLRDDDPQVRREALVAAGKLKNPRLWPLVIESLSSLRVRAEAVSALIAGGEAVVPYLRTAFSGQEQPVEALVCMARACGRIRGSEAVALLRDKMDFPDAEVRYQVLASLGLCGYRAQGDDVSAVEQKVNEEIAAAVWTLAAQEDIGEEEALALPRAALKGKWRKHQEQIFFLLSFIYDIRFVKSAWDALALTSDSGGKKAYALEVIDTLIPHEMKVNLFPLLEDLPTAERLRRLAGSFPQQSLGLNRRLQEMATGPVERLTPWMRACALWALSGREPETYRDCLDDLRRAPDPGAALVLRILEAENGDGTMLSTVEKVIILKTVNIFAETPDEVLVEVASSLDEAEVKAGEMVFAKGDRGNSLYIIVQGKVRVHDGERIIATLGDRDVFGEMSVLDTQPRSASATAMADTRLFRLGQDIFYELMADRIEVVRGIIQVLCQRLRAAQSGVERAEEKPERSDMMGYIFRKLEWL